LTDACDLSRGSDFPQRLLSGFLTATARQIDPTSSPAFQRGMAAQKAVDAAKVTGKPQAAENTKKFSPARVDLRAALADGPCLPTEW